MEFGKFIKLLKKHKYGLIALPLMAMVIAFFLTRKQPSVYASQSRLSAGLTAGSQTAQLAQQILGGSDNMAEAKINQTFSNVTQTMQLKIVFDQVSYQLMIHDLTLNTPFRPQSKLLRQLNEAAVRHAIDVYTKMYNLKQSLYLTDPDQNGLNDLIKSMGYNYEALKDKVRIYRVEASDFIDVYYESENPSLTEFVVNTLCREFINYYSELNQQNKVKATEFLHNLVLQKRDSLNNKMDRLRDFKVKNKVLSIPDEEKNYYAQIGDFQTKLQTVEKEVASNQGAINAIDAKFSAEEREYIEAKMAGINQDIVSVQEQLSALNDQYIKSDFDPAIKTKLDAMKVLLTQKINQSTDRLAVSPLATKQALVTQKLKMENDLALAKNSIASYKNAIATLQYKLQSLAPSQAAIQNYEADITVASKEYLDLQSRYDQSAMQLNSTIPIKVIEPALPGSKLPSKKLMLVAMSGVVSLALYLMLLFVLFYLDDSIRFVNDLVNKTDTKVLGWLPTVKTSMLDVQRMWSIEAPGPLQSEVKKLIGMAGSEVRKMSNIPVPPVNMEFKKMVRSTRFEINMALTGGRNLVVTSLEEGEGKTLVALSMVSSFQVMNKKVLLIDGNFINPGITMMTHPQYYIEDYLLGRTTLSQFTGNGSVTVLGNKGLDVSLFEINTEAEIEQRMLELKDVFDIIFIEAPALSTLNQSKEWAVVADRVLCVFEANQSITSDMKEMILYLKEMNGKFIGWILNKVTK